MPKSYFARREPAPPPTDKRFRMRVGNSHHLIVTTSLLGVEVEYFTRIGQTEGDWKVWLDYTDNPDLEGLRHPRLGWDLVGLARLLWAYVGVAETIHLNGTKDGKLSAPFQLREGTRQWREETETRSLICSVLAAADHPLSRRDIAQAIGLSKHSRLNQLIEAMVGEGLLIKSELTLQNGKRKYLYSNNKDSGQ